MNYLTNQLLNPEELKILNATLKKQDLIWEDGKRKNQGFSSI